MEPDNDCDTLDVIAIIESYQMMCLAGVSDIKIDLKYTDGWFYPIVA